MSSDKRDSSIELLRIIAVFMIVLHHLTYHCVYQQLTDAASISHFNNGFFNNPVFYIRLLIVDTLMPLGKTANSVFLLITGFFLAERSGNLNPAKPVKKILSQMVFATILITVGSVVYYHFRREAFVSLQGVDSFNGAWWFAGYYFCVVIVGIVGLNGFLSKLSKQGYTAWLIVFFGFFSLGWSGALLDNLSNGLRTLAAGVWLYSMGGYIKKYNPFARIRLWVLIAGFIGVYVMVWLSYYNSSLNNIQKYFQGDQSSAYYQYIPTYVDYSIVPISQGILLFETGRRIRIPKSRLINWMGGASFMVYLIHDNSLMRYIWRERDFIVKLYNSPLQFCVYMIKWAAFVYFLGCACYLIYQTAMNLLSKIKDLGVFVSNADEQK